MSNTYIGSTSTDDTLCPHRNYSDEWVSLGNVHKVLLKIEKEYAEWDNSSWQDKQELLTPYWFGRVRAELGIPLNLFGINIYSDSSVPKGEIHMEEEK